MARLHSRGSLSGIVQACAGLVLMLGAATLGAGPPCTAACPPLFLETRVVHLQGCEKTDFRYSGFCACGGSLVAMWAGPEPIELLVGDVEAGALKARVRLPFEPDCLRWSSERHALYALGGSVDHRCLLVVDMTDPAAPRLHDPIRLPAGSSCVDVAADGSHQLACVADARNPVVYVVDLVRRGVVGRIALTGPCRCLSDLQQSGLLYAGVNRPGQTARGAESWSGAIDVLDTRVRHRVQSVSIGSGQMVALVRGPQRQTLYGIAGGRPTLVSAAIKPSGLLGPAVGARIADSEFELVPLGGTGIVCSGDRTRLFTCVDYEYNARYVIAIQPGTGAVLGRVACAGTALDIVASGKDGAPEVVVHESLGDVIAVKVGP